MLFVLSEESCSAAATAASFDKVAAAAAGGAAGVAAAAVVAFFCFACQSVAYCQYFSSSNLARLFRGLCCGHIRCDVLWSWPRVSLLWLFHEGYIKIIFNSKLKVLSL